MRSLQRAQLFQLWSIEEVGANRELVSANDGIIGRKASCSSKWTYKNTNFQIVAHADFERRRIVTGGFDKMSSTVSVVNSGCWTDLKQVWIRTIEELLPSAKVFFSEMVHLASQ